MTHQTNLFNTDPQVAGFKLDYMELGNIQRQSLSIESKWQ